MVTLQLQQLHIPPGQRVVLEQISWSSFEAILSELESHAGLRLAYYQGVLEFVAPLPEHEQAKVVLGDLVKILLDELDLDWEPMGSATLKREAMDAGVKPDDCFYIQHHAAVVGCERLDLDRIPPPDLALEVDVTSKTKVSAYAALGIPEIWRYEKKKLHIYRLTAAGYLEVGESNVFSGIDVSEGVAMGLEASRTLGTRPALKAFRQWVKQQLSQR